MSIAVMDLKCLDQHLVLRRLSVNTPIRSFPLVLLPEKHCCYSSLMPRALDMCSISLSRLLLSKCMIISIGGLLRNNQIVFVWVHQKTELIRGLWRVTVERASHPAGVGVFISSHEDGWLQGSRMGLGRDGSQGLPLQPQGQARTLHH